MNTLKMVSWPEFASANGWRWRRMQVQQGGWRAVYIYVEKDGFINYAVFKNEDGQPVFIKQISEDQTWKYA